MHCSAYNPVNVVQTISERNDSVISIIDGSVLTVSRTVRALGVVLDDKPTLSDHVTPEYPEIFGYVSEVCLGSGVCASSCLFFCQYCDPAYGNSIWRKGTERIHECKTPPCATLYGMIKCPLTEMQQICYQWSNMKWKQYVGCWLAVQSKRFLLQENLPIPFGRGFINSGRRSPYVTRKDGRLHFSSTALEFEKSRFSYFGHQFFYNHPGVLREV